jgi:large subunit ribosomal protein L14e
VRLYTSICNLFKSHEASALTAIEVGTICVKTFGREAGKKCVIVDVIDKNYILITGPKSVNKVKRRKSNVNHVEPTQEKIEIKRGATDEEIIEALKSAGKLDEMAKQVKPSMK